MNIAPALLRPMTLWMWTKTLGWALASAFAILASGCLALDDYTLVEGPDAGTECKSGEYQCLDEQTPQRCVRGFWVDIDPCEQDQTCSVEVGGCVCKENTYRCLQAQEQLQVCKGGDWGTLRSCNEEEEDQGFDLVCSATEHDCVCRDGIYRCVDQSLQVCTGEDWELESECPPDTFCSKENGACVACRPGVDHTCNGTELMQCAADGSGFSVPVKDCAQEGDGLQCDTTVVPDDCFECRQTDRRCAGNLLTRCMDNQFTAGGTNCDFSPGCVEVDGYNDYCPECSIPGEEVCDGRNQRKRCGDDYILEVLEQCLNNCTVQAGTSVCE